MMLLNPDGRITPTVFYSTYDVKDLLKKGDNVIGAYVASGWWQGAIAHGKYNPGYYKDRKPDLGFAARLDVHYTDGTSDIVYTEPETWKYSLDGPVIKGDIYDGEVYDARKESVWTTPKYDDSAWQTCALNTDAHVDIRAFVGPTVQVRTQLQRTPVKITRYEGITATGSDYGKINVKETYTQPAAILLPKGQTLVYDMGQNMTGWVRFKVKGNSGTEVTLRFAEMLNDEGKKSRGDDGPGGSLYRINLRSAKATLQYTLKGDVKGEEYSPTTTFFGFRYCDLTATDSIEIESLTGEVVGTATYNADLAAFFRKWMGDMHDSQRGDGAYPDVAPHCWVGWGQAAWAEAGIIIPWTVYLMYNDKGILEENYDSMERYMIFLADQADEKYRYNGAGTNYGDWVGFIRAYGQSLYQRLLLCFRGFADGKNFARFKFRF